MSSPREGASAAHTAAREDGSEKSLIGPPPGADPPEEHLERALGNRHLQMIAIGGAIGTGVLGGMLSATVLAIVFIPLFFVVVMRLFKSHRALEITAVPVQEH